MHSARVAHSSNDDELLQFVRFANDCDERNARRVGQTFFDLLSNGLFVRVRRIDELDVID